MPNEGRIDTMCNRLNRGGPDEMTVKARNVQSGRKVLPRGLSVNAGLLIFAGLAASPRNFTQAAVFYG